MNNPTQFIIVQERAEGNAEVGTSWPECATFPPTATLAEVWEWALIRGGMTGSTILRPDLRSSLGKTETQEK